MIARTFIAAVESIAPGVEFHDDEAGSAAFRFPCGKCKARVLVSVMAPTASPVTNSKDIGTVARGLVRAAVDHSKRNGCAECVKPAIDSDGDSGHGAQGDPATLEQTTRGETAAGAIVMEPA